jgi:peptidoglycan/LPS O-acetylase OafA/YrhL
VFAAGSVVSGLSLLWRGQRHLVADLLVLAGLFGAAWAMWAVSPARAPESFGWLGAPYNFPFFHLGIALALLAFPHARLLPALSELAPIRYIAKISFGIYIWHFMILELIRQFFAPSFGYAGISDTSYWLTLTSISLALALVAGSLSWYGIERPSLNWAKRFEPGKAVGAEPIISPQKLHA